MRTGIRQIVRIIWRNNIAPVIAIIVDSGIKNGTSVLHQMVALAIVIAVITIYC